MKITDVKVIGFSATTYIGPDKDGHGHPCKPRKGAYSILRIETDAGITGEYSRATTNPRPTERYDEKLVQTCGDSTSVNGLRGAIDKIRPVLIGEDPLCRERIFVKLFRMQRLYFDVTDPVVSLVDQALWDIAGKAAGMPVHKLIGGHRTKVRAYGSIMVGDDIPGGLATPEDYANYAGQLLKRGYTAIKLHTWMDENWNDGEFSGRPSWKKDVEACRLVREAVGEDVPLMLDAFHNYPREEALAIGRALEKLSFRWIEEPMDEYSLSSYKYLCDNLDLPVCGPETMMGKAATRAEWIREGACDIARAGVNDVGGLTPLLKIVHLCEAYGMPIDLHGPCMGNLNMLSAITVPGEFFERGLLHPFLDYDAMPPWLERPMDEMDENGFVLLNDRPGFGFQFNEDYLKRNAL